MDAVAFWLPLSFDLKNLEVEAQIKALGSPPLAFAGQDHRSPRPPRPIYGWFTEGFDTADLKDAKSLLDELS